ncbi:sensor histidine kinase [Synergistes jonesii]|uniref:histidine kinase n=1 Tax=Synergistes jonesii TaxID=2754 RepID=A0A073INV9_9BACT|nr:ATP-binding protein [Synergistes jonesii]KEJ92013.1 hypothetical protein EH55_06415 [Synergistes jonesii]
MIGNGERQLILDAIFQNIADPMAICRVTEREDGQKDLVYVRVNDAYEKLNNTKRESLIGKLYSSVWKEDTTDWGGVMIRVAETGNTGYGEEFGDDAKSGFFEAESSVAPGYYQLFIFSPIPDWVVMIFRNMNTWRKVAVQLKKKEKLLRKLTAGLTLAEEKTRRTIAAKLHDSIGYSMVGMLHSLRTLYEEQRDAEQKMKVAAVVEKMERLLQETRSFTFDISPPILYEVGLSAALEARCDNLQITHGIKCAFKCEGKETNLDEDTKILLYQMTHELLVNVVKHAEATGVLVIIRWGAKNVQIIVEDDGKGFTPSKNNRKSNSGMGLFSIRERLRSVNGEMKIVSTPKKGTTVSLVAPIQSRE